MNKKHLTILLAMLTIHAARIGQPSEAAEIRHRFLAVGESRGQLLYVDQSDPSNDWTLKLPFKHRDLQLVGDNRVLLSTADGYREYDLTNREVVREVKGYPGAMSARRLPNGHTVLACAAEGVQAYELSPDGELLRKVIFDVPTTRVVRLTPQNTILFGSANQVFEGDPSGNLVRQHTLPEGVWAYQAVRLPNGHLMVAGGYDTRMLEVDTEGNVVRTIGGNQTPQDEALGLHFIGGFQILKNGHIVVCNWTGHGVDDGEKGVQILQYNTEGEVVWKWHDPVRAGSINAVIVMDDLDPAVLNDDVSSVLKPLNVPPRRSPRR